MFWDPLACRLVGILDLEAPPETTPPPRRLRLPLPRKRSPRRHPTTHRCRPCSDSLPLQGRGPFPLAKTAGASDSPRYFGFRLVKGVPEFLYTCGGLSIEERLWLDQGGSVLKQRFSVKDASRGLQIAVPEAWKGRIEASAGTWKGAILTVPKEASTEVILSYPLAPAGNPPAPEPKSL